MEPGWRTRRAASSIMKSKMVSLPFDLPLLTVVKVPGELVTSVALSWGNCELHHRLTVAGTADGAFSGSSGKSRESTESSRGNQGDRVARVAGGVESHAVRGFSADRTGGTTDW